jgi:RHS repeat-associated protein
MSYEYAPNASALVRTMSVNTQSQTQVWHPDTTYTKLDAAGNVLASGQRSYRTTATGQGLQINLVSSSATQHYYGADEKLRFLQKYHWTGEGTKGTFDEYRYDALGRRVLQRMRRDSPCTGSECPSAIERYVWSGDQLLYEIRAPGGDNATPAQLESDVPSGDEYGRVGYTHAAGIDAPLSVIRTGYVSGNITIIPHSDYRGSYHAGSTPAGAAYNCGPSDPCLYVVFPKQYWGGYYDGGDPSAGDWAGSLIRGQQDISGLMYRRNRYYDPMTGQFTQSDPVGIAGGLNTYGFAKGDPVSYSDPYGLWPCPPDNDCGPETYSGQVIQAAEQWFADKAAQALDIGGDIAKGIGEVTGLNDFLRAGFGFDPNTGADVSAGGRVASGALLLFTVVPESAVLSNLRRTVRAAAGADVTVSRIGSFYRATWQVGGEARGQSRTVWTKIINSEGRTVRLYHDSYDRAGRFQHRKFKVPDFHRAQ